MSADSLYVGDASKTYTSFVADIDVANESRTVASDGKRGPARELRINGGSGAIALQFPDKSTDTITGLNVGDFLRLKVAKILAAGTTGLTSVTVIW